MRAKHRSPIWIGSTALLVAVSIVTAPGWMQAATGTEPTLGRSPAASALLPTDRPVLERVSTAAIRAAAEPHRPDRARTALLVRIPGPIPVTSRPGGGVVVGTFPAASRYYHVPVVAWILRTASDGRFGLVTVPYSGTQLAGWIRIRGLRRERTAIQIRVDLSLHTLTLRRWGRTLARFPAATGAPTSPTPPGRYFVTDRVPFPAGSALGSFAFGISGIQTHLPAGWSGGDQLAIHGTNAPSSIGTSTSAGCIRVSEAALARLEPLLRLGTPVVIVP
ncbi:MAG TPA: L,D-transpeptidase [Actinomycetota bacterium]